MYKKRKKNEWREKHERRTPLTRDGQRNEEKKNTKCEQQNSRAIVDYNGYYTEM